MHLEGVSGALVYDVFLGSPADRGGLLPGDYITNVNGVKIKDSSHLVLIVGDLIPGKLARFDLIRDGKKITLNIRIAIREEEKKVIALKKNLWPGFSVIGITDEIIKELKMKKGTKGVVVGRVEDGTPGYKAGLKELDIIEKIDGRPVEGVIEFYRYLNENRKKKYALSIKRSDEEIEIELTR